MSAASALKPTRALPSMVLKKFSSVKTVLEKFNSEMKLHHYGIRDFRPNVSFSFERGSFLVKTAENGMELEECLKLRFDVFHKEYMHKKRTIGVDIDKLDEICDHLVIFDKRVGRVIGTYRMNCSLFTDTFYSSNEFNMDEILARPGTKLELGRACIDREYRNGVVIALLWRAISEYVRRTGTEILFGCASVKTMEPLEIGLITKYLTDQGFMDFDQGVTATRKYKVKQIERVLEYLELNPFEYNKDEVEKLIPTLFHSYLKAGAKACGEPAIDRDFRCIDFLTCLKIDQMNPAFARKYNP